MVYLSFFILPFLVAMGAFLFSGRKITVKELAAQLAVQAILVLIISECSTWSNTSDTEIWNGRVASKTKDRTSCEHSYECYCTNVCSKSGDTETCTKVCQTCYDHDYDIDWNVHTNIGTSMDISRVDRQGLSEPPRWTSTVIGEPVSVPHDYTNYIKGAPDTLFRTQDDTVVEVPTYPGNIYDYYRLDRVITYGGVSLPDIAQWNKDLSEINADLGPEKQANVIIVFAGNKTRDWFQHLQRLWIGGKKNDIVVTIGSEPDGKITWCEVMAWTDRAVFKVRLRDAILDVGTIDRSKVLPVIASEVRSSYVRKHMSDFKYLLTSVRPSVTAYVIGILIGLIMAVGLSIFFWENDIFDEERRRYGWN